LNCAIFKQVAGGDVLWCISVASWLCPLQSWNNTVAAGLH